MAFVRRKQDEPIPPGDRRSRGRDLSGLVESLRSEDPAVRRWAARDLASYPEATDALFQQLMVEKVPSVREAIFTSLTLIGTREVVEGLMELLRSDDASLRNEAIEAMKNLPEAVSPVMESLLADPDSDVRIFAINILESLKHPNVEKWLIEVLRDEEHVNVCAAAIDLLGEVGSEMTIPALEEVRERFPDEPFIEFAVDLALKRIGES
jgi:HEAT repeat protein